MAEKLSFSLAQPLVAADDDFHWDVIVDGVAVAEIFPTFSFPSGELAGFRPDYFWGGELLEDPFEAAGLALELTLERALG